MLNDYWIQIEKLLQVIQNSSKGEIITTYYESVHLEDTYGFGSNYPKDIGKDTIQLLGAFYYDVRKFLDISSDSRVLELVKIAKETCFELEEKSQDYPGMLKCYRKFKYDTLSLEIDISVKLSVENNRIRDILDGDIDSNHYMKNYGKPLCDTDNQLSSFLKTYDVKQLDLIASTITNAFLHGFVSQNRNRRERTCIKMTYMLGQEKIAKRVIALFNEQGIYPNIFQVSGHVNEQQYEYDHKYDIGLILDDDYLYHYKATLKKIYDQYADVLKNVCGYIGIGSFGKLEEPPMLNKYAVKLTDSQEKLFKAMHLSKRLAEDKYIRPSDISFCKITFPNPTIKGNFKKIFDDFVAINTMTGDVYEGYQQIIIDELDKGEFVHCKGKNGNQTDIVVALGAINDSSKQTNFMNCGGDLNIPHGEVFTTPKLKGTKGILHFKQLFLKGYHYTDLKLKFRDGLVVDYKCENFPTLEENRDYVYNTLLNGNENVPMGEFAIGTNTLAYSIVKKHGIIEELPILLVEKMGPHFAIGDPCYAFGEDEKVFNLLDGKEIIAKENELSALRKNDISKAYVGMHTDLTVPYEDIYDLRIVGHGYDATLIRHGYFAIDALEPLNEPLREAAIDFTPFVDAFREFLMVLYNQKNKLMKKGYFDQKTSVLKQDNAALYQLFLEDYDESLINPSHAFAHYGEQGLVLSAILFDCKEMILLLYRKKEIQFNYYVSFIHQVLELIEEGRLHLVQKYYMNFKSKMVEELDYREYQSHYLDRVFSYALLEENYLFRYGYYVNSYDLLTSKALGTLDINLLETSGSIIAHAFHKSFKTAGKEKGNRDIVKLEYHLGQEPLMSYVASHLKLLGYRPKITKVFPSSLNERAALDHGDDQGLYLTHEFAILKKQRLKDLMVETSKVLKSVCGFVRLLQFGAIEESNKLSSDRLSLSEEAKEELKDLTWFERKYVGDYMPKAEMSYTGAAYPSASIEGDYEEILKQIIAINNMDATVHEAIQDRMIEAIDGAAYVHVKGREANCTDIKIKLLEDFDPKCESIFKNTGADVNLPLGEIFTTPVLKGTTGILHVSEVYRDSFRYENLQLEFEDGIIKKYECRNFVDESDNKAYIEETLLYPHKTLPMGEFAIGTNTYAYHVSRRYKLVDKLPGLIVEKMGPHFAIGDTCYAYGEDVCVVNHTTGKEVVAKDNELTIKRLQGEKVYYHSHTDITIPYEELAFVKAIFPNGKVVTIIENGKFSMKGTEILNEYLK